MKSRQLANVLLKLLGFSLCLYAIPTCVSGVFMAIQAKDVSGTGDIVFRAFSYAIGYGVQALVGIIIIATSRKIAAWMFKSDEE